LISVLYNFSDNNFSYLTRYLPGYLTNSLVMKFNLKHP